MDQLRDSGQIFYQLSRLQWRNRLERALEPKYLKKTRVNGYRFHYLENNFVPFLLLFKQYMLDEEDLDEVSKNYRSHQHHTSPSDS